MDKGLGTQVWQKWILSSSNLDVVYSFTNKDRKTGRMQRDH